MAEAVGGFDWDEGNWPKCGKHRVSRAEIEALFARPLLVVPDVAHSQGEERLRAIGRTEEGRAVFLVFTLRNRGGTRLIRPVSARYMHDEEVKGYEAENPDLQDG